MLDYLSSVLVFIYLKNGSWIRALLRCQNWAIKNSLELLMGGHYVNFLAGALQLSRVSCQFNVRVLLVLVQSRCRLESSVLILSYRSTFSLSEMVSRKLFTFLVLNFLGSIRQDGCVSLNEGWMQVFVELKGGLSFSSSCCFRWCYVRLEN